MEGSESEAMFKAMNLNPRLFVNEARNIVDEMLEGAFNCCHEQARQIIGSGAYRSEELDKGIFYLRHLTQEVADRKMCIWETDCLQNCFSIPDGFVLPKSNESLPSVLETRLSDEDLNCQLDSLREKLAAVGKESEEFQKEISLLEKQSTVNASVAEVQQLFEEQSVLKMYQESVESSSRLAQKVVELKRKRSEVMELDRQGKKLYDFSEKEMHPECVSSVKLEDIQEILSILKK